MMTDDTLHLLQRCFAFVLNVLETPGTLPDTLEAGEELKDDLVDAIQQRLREAAPDDGEALDG